MPPVNTSASSPPSAAAIDPSSRQTRYTNYSTASPARRSSLASNSRMSDEIPETNGTYKSASREVAGG